VIYIVDDDDAVRDALGLLFEAEGLASEAYASAQRFLDELPLLTPACVVTDVHMAGVNGLQLLRHLKSLGGDVPVVVITGRADRALAAQALAAGAAAFVEKPFHADEIVAAVRSAMAGGA
jgi:two-component system, LuxR family, response regulator FixJ